jgi:ribosomal protein S12 methylthiotransferase accessory factor
VSGANNSTANLFLSAANLLLGERSDATGDHDAKQMLRALDYALPGGPAAPGAPEIVNRARLLMAASRFARAFELAAPDAPGLVSFGAQFDPVLADPLHAGSPLVGVSGVGVSLQDAFQGCIGEAIEYLSQLQSGSDALLDADIDQGVAGLGPPGWNLSPACRNAERARTPDFPGIGRHGPAMDAKFCCRPIYACAGRCRSVTSRRRFR